jgi:hypothetical protein
LQSFGAIPDSDLGAGVYRLPDGFQIGIVVIRNLPEIPGTPWLRGLGKDKILTNAFANIRKLPGTRRERNDIVEVCIKHFKYLIEKSATGLSQEEEDFMKTMQEIDAIYRSEMAQARLEGLLMGEAREYELVLRQLKRRVGDISNDMEDMVKALSVERLEALGEALLDFTQMADLMSWLERNQ